MSDAIFEVFGIILGNFLDDPWTIVGVFFLTILGIVLDDFWTIILVVFITILANFLDDSWTILERFLELSGKFLKCFLCRFRAWWGT